jgi:hypothetical protein
VDDLAIQNRYFRSLKLLEAAVRSVDRIVLFDNSDTGLFTGRAVCEIANDRVWTKRYYGTRIEIAPMPHIPKWVLEVLQQAYNRLRAAKPEIYEIRSASDLIPSPEERLEHYRLMGPANVMEYYLKRHMMT